MKHSKSMIAGFVILVGILAFSLYGINLSLAYGNYESMEREYYHERAEHENQHNWRTSVKPYPAFQEECGSCHMAYPPQLLPAQSWQKLMSGLDNHFGENAQLDEKSKQNIENFLIQTSSKTNYRKILRNLDGQAPLRITELPYFVHEHNEIPSRFVQGNDKVGSFSQCNACHKRAEQGGFDEDNVSIPGVGRWDD
jgi:hypothetical protein